MQERSLRLSWREFSDAGELPTEERKLLEAATGVLDNAYAPYSQFHVGAALLLANGEIFSAANYENAAYPMCLCAERGVLAAATAAFPQVPPVGMAITVRHPRKSIAQPAAPCGACRQVLVETEGRFGQSFYVLLRGAEGPVYRFGSARELLPFSFDGSFL